MQVLSPLDIVMFHDGSWNHRGHLTEEEMEEDHIVYPVGSADWQVCNDNIQKEATA